MLASSVLVPIAWGAAALLLWQVGIAAVCLLPLRLLRPGADRIALWLAFQILAAGLVAALLTFARANSPAVYCTVAAVGLLLGVLGGRGLPTVRLGGLLGAGLAALAGVLLGLVLRPVEEIDSLYNLHYVLGWFSNEFTPFRFAYNYVPFWELTYLPSLVLARSDVFLWFESLKAVALVGLLLFVLARELGMSERLAVLAPAALLTFPHLWNGPSGVATVKNDMIHAAGQVAMAVLCVRAAKGTLARADTALLAVGAVFLSVKFSGPFLLAAGCLAALLAAYGKIRKHWRELLRALIITVLVWLPTVGIYYLRNAITYQNPFYPFEINLILLRLPGRADLSYSAISSNLGDVRLWQAFFWPPGGWSPAGLLFPAILAVLLLGSIAVCLREVGLRLRGRGGSPLLAAGALYQLVAWGVYVRSIYSASGYPGDLAFVLNELNSLRYVEGALLVGELFLVRLLVGHRKLEVAAVLMLVLNGASRLAQIVRREPDLSWAGVAAVAIVLAGAWFLLPSRWRVATAGLLLVAGAIRVEQRRAAWLPHYQPLYRPVYELARQRIFYIVDDEFSQQHCAHLPLAGRRLQHEVIVGPTCQASTMSADWVAWLRRLPSDPTPPPPAGFRLSVEAPAGALFRAVEPETQ